MRRALLVLPLLLAACPDLGTPKPGDDTAPEDCLDLDGDGFSGEDCDEDGRVDDCDDDDPTRHPGASETCDGRDEDCDGEADEDAVDVSAWHLDADGDGWGLDEAPVLACEAPAGYIEVGGDCDDDDASRFPGAPETCDGRDEDCDGEIDEDATDPSPWHPDADGDGFGTADLEVLACAPPAGHLADASDCDDERPTVHPDALEVCDGLDNDCDGDVDEDEATDASTWYLDDDGDGWGVDASALRACDPPPGYTARGRDCDDSRSGVNPSATERCDGLDDDCDGVTDEDDAEDAPTWYLDADEDGYGDASRGRRACAEPEGWLDDATDCDDGDPDVNPAATERCDGLDDDCDGAVDEDDAEDVLPWFLDDDDDGYGDPAAVAWACAPPERHVDDATDCDDADPSIHPDAEERCNDLDDDCDGLADEGVLGRSAACPAADCAEILEADPEAPSGAYYLGAYTWTCDMDTDGGGWVKVASSVHLWGTSYDTTWHNAAGFAWNEVLFAWSSGSVHAHCTYPESLTSCNNLGFQFSSEYPAWGLPLNWGSSLCGAISTRDYGSATTYLDRDGDGRVWDFIISRATTSTDTLRIGTLEGIASCTTSDNPGNAYVDVYLRR
jgi:hypothetical protein